MFNTAFFAKEYLKWHYGRAVPEIFELTKNFLWFGYHFFSIGLLSKTLFAPFRRIKESGAGWDMEMILENIVANAVSRLVGFILRSLILTAGFVFEAAIFLAAFPILIFWLFLPALILTLFFLGIVFLL